MATDCEPVRAALSALLDGEDPLLPQAVVDEHVVTCDGCTAYAATLPRLGERVAAFRALPVPDRTDLVMSGAATRVREQHGPSSSDLRGLLWLAAGVQMIVAVFSVLGVGGAGHVVRDLAVLEIATAGGLAAVAWRPSLAPGVLPVIAVAAVAGSVASVGDVLVGASSVAAELSHLVLLVATWPLVVLARRGGPGGTVEAV